MNWSILRFVTCISVSLLLVAGKARAEEDVSCNQRDDVMSWAKRWDVNYPRLGDSCQELVQRLRRAANQFNVKCKEMNNADADLRRIIQYQINRYYKEAVVVTDGQDGEGGLVRCPLAPDNKTKWTLVIAGGTTSAIGLAIVLQSIADWNAAYDAYTAYRDKRKITGDTPQTKSYLTAADDGEHRGATKDLLGGAVFVTGLATGLVGFFVFGTNGRGASSALQSWHFVPLAPRGGLGVGVGGAF
jgi:hypothetical protein